MKRPSAGRLFRKKLNITVNTKNESERAKIVIFAPHHQFELDLIEKLMLTMKCRYLRLDGNTPQSHRRNIIDKFQSEESVLVMLASIRAAGEGITLHAAHIAIMYSIDYNPQVQEQVNFISLKSMNVILNT